MMLELNELSVNYGNAKALEKISMNVDRGELICLIGANGAGKTTILRTISGLKKPHSGEIIFKGKRLDGMPAHDVVKLGIAHIPAGRMIFGPMTVSDNLKIGAFLRKDKRQIDRDLDNIYSHFPILQKRQAQLGEQMSGGEQQMLAVARALMAAPELLLMDEPSIGLSPLLVAEVSKIIRNINEDGKSILLVEQNCRMALKLAKRAYVLELGRIVLEGNAKELANDERVKKYYLGGT